VALFIGPAQPRSAFCFPAFSDGAAVGYVFGGVAGPFAVGGIYDWTRSWTIASLFFLAVSVASPLSGIRAGRTRTVQLALR